MEIRQHPLDPHSNVSKFSGYDPEKFSNGCRVLENAAWVGSHKLDRQPGEGRGRPLDADGARPVVVEIFGGDLCPAVDVFPLNGYYEFQFEKSVARTCRQNVNCVLIPLGLMYLPHRHLTRYALDKVSLTVLTDESLTPGKPPCLTQRAIGKFLQPLTRELVEVPPRPTIDELPDAVIDRMVQRDKAFWVDKPGANAYTLHDAYYNYNMTTEQILPNRQAVFPRSYKYDLDCVRYRRQHACDGLNDSKRKISTHCHDCQKWSKTTNPTANQLATPEDPEQKRWKYYPELTNNLSTQEINKLMKEVGRPFQNEACNWYYSNYPPVKYDYIIRKFSK